MHDHTEDPSAPSLPLNAFPRTFPAVGLWVDGYNLAQLREAVTAAAGIARLGAELEELAIDATGERGRDLRAVVERGRFPLFNALEALAFHAGELAEKIAERDERGAK